MQKQIVNQMQEAFQRAYASENDEELADLILLFMQEPSVYTLKKKCLLYEAFDVAGFFINSKCFLMRRFAIEVTNFIDRIDFKNQIIEKMKGNLEGLELSNSSRTLFCVLSNETYSGLEHLVRATWFDYRGFSGHINSCSWKKLLDEVVSCGYKKIATGSLNELSNNESFISGNNATTQLLKQA